VLELTEGEAGRDEEGDGEVDEAGKHCFILYNLVGEVGDFQPVIGRNIDEGSMIIRRCG
jgi:hypothetical protein